MTDSADVLVIGAGPAGLAAAREAAGVGLQVIVVDENREPGGQIYRQLPHQFRDRRERHGGAAQIEADLMRSVWALPVRFLHGATAWGRLEPGTVDVAREGRNHQIRARSVVVAVGANDRPVPLPGWTLPGVLTAGGAQSLLKSQRILPGRRILLAGAGPLQLVAASQLAAAGADVVAVTEAVPARRHLRHALRLAWGGRVLLDGVRYMAAIRRARIPWIAPAVLTRIEGEDRVEAAVVARADPAWRPVPGTERRFEVDAVCLGYGLVPSLEVIRMLGCQVRYDPVGDAWVPVRDGNGETTVPDVFAVGDGAGVAGVNVALEEGRLAGMILAVRYGQRANASTLEARISGVKRRIRRLNRFASAINEIYTPGPGLYELAEPDTAVCRCEEVSLDRIQGCLESGARDLKQLKGWTRIGMGPCQGKNCGAAAARLVSGYTGKSLPEVGLFSVRPPVRPIQLGSLLSPTDSDESGLGQDLNARS